MILILQNLKEFVRNSKITLLISSVPLSQKNPVILEAGGHYGLDTEKMAYKWPKATIHTFEPNPNAFSKLITLENHNIHPYQKALAQFNGKGCFYICYGTTGDNPIFEGASSLLPASEGMKIHYQGPIEAVDCVILDDWCLDNGVDKIDFMWLDLEGMELQVLKSSPKILKTVKCIYTETNFQEFRLGMTQYAELRKFLEDSGFYMLSHWYQENLQGNALFIRKSN
jgi:FkbM family methyltransferase